MGFWLIYSKGDAMMKQTQQVNVLVDLDKALTELVKCGAAYQDMKRQRDTLLKAADSLATRAERARAVLQDKFVRKGWDKDTINEWANWGMLDTTELRAIISNAKKERK